MIHYERQRIYSSRDTTPRQFRLAAQRNEHKERIQSLFSAIAGGILLGLIIIIFSIL